MLRSLLVLALGVFASCYSPSYQDCQVSCAGGTCPSGLTCLEGVCRRPGMSGACTALDAAPVIDGSIPFEGLGEAVVDTICTRAVECGTFEDHASCVALTANQIFINPDLATAIAEGTIVYDPEEAAKCLAGFAQAECVRLPASFLPNTFQTRSCNSALVGTIVDGGTCVYSDQCVSKVCSKPSTCGSDRCCTGTCAGSTPPGERNLGEPCTYQDTCIGSRCSFQNPSQCIPYISQGMTCTSDFECAPGNVCRQSDQTCQPQVPTDGPCSRTLECRELSDVCSSGKCVAGGLMGFSCSTIDQCQPQHYCATNGGVGTCSLPPMVGQSCMQFGVCQNGYCRQPEGACFLRGKESEPCNPSLSGTDCETRYCDMASMRCAPMPMCL